jgi:hypothetical protein
VLVRACLSRAREGWRGPVFCLVNATYLVSASRLLRLE